MFFLFYYLLISCNRNKVIKNDISNKFPVVISQFDSVMQVPVDTSLSMFSGALIGCFDVGRDSITVDTIFSLPHIIRASIQKDDSISIQVDPSQKIILHDYQLISIAPFEMKLYTF